MSEHGTCPFRPRAPLPGVAPDQPAAPLTPLQEQPSVAQSSIERSTCAEVLEALEERLDRHGPPWGNSKLLASVIEDGYVAGIEARRVAEILAAALQRIADSRGDEEPEGGWTGGTQYLWCRAVAQEALADLDRSSVESATEASSGGSGQDADASSAKSASTAVEGLCVCGHGKGAHLHGVPGTVGDCLNGEICGCSAFSPARDWNISPNPDELRRWARAEGEHGEWTMIPTSAFVGLLWVLEQADSAASRAGCASDAPISGGGGGQR